jgi:hypothetical protein
MITGAEVSIIAKASSDVTKGVRAALAQPPIGWPNAHEALMELYIILDDWCEAAAKSNEAARTALDARLGDDELPNLGGRAADGFAGTNIAHGYVERIARDTKGVLNPRAPWASRWRKSQKRAAARRTLRSMLRIYSPELLETYEAAVNSRATWVAEHRRNFKAALTDSQTPLDDLDAMVNQMDETLGSLLAVRNDLRELINGSFPLGPIRG